MTYRVDMYAVPAHVKKKKHACKKRKLHFCTVQAYQMEHFVIYYKVEADKPLALIV